MRLAAIGCWLALLGAAAAPAAAGPGFFTGVVDAPDVLAEGGGPIADLGLGGALVWVEWEPHLSAPTARQVADVEGVASALAPGGRLLVAAGSSGASTPLDAPSRNRFCGFVRALLAAVPAVRDVVVWNEPNKQASWRPQFDETGASAAPAAYLALLARCWDVLHAFRPGVNVVMPATSPSGNDNPNAVSNVSHSPTSFLRRLGEAYRASGRTKRIFDTLGHHPYGVSSRERPWRVHGERRQISQGDWARLLATAQEAFAGTPQPPPGQCDERGCVWIWYTEAGFQTQPSAAKEHLYAGTETAIVVPDDAGGDPDGEPLAQFAPDQRTQLEDAIRLAACQPYVQALFNYLLVDEVPLNRWQSGFLWADGTPKGSFRYARAAIAEAAAGAVDCAGLKGGPPPAPDSVPPAAPARVKARPGRGRVALAWARNADPDVMGYLVDRAGGPRGSWQRLTARPVARPSFVDATVANGRTYRYAVTAVDTVGNASERSEPVCATPTPRSASHAVATVRVRAGRARGPAGAARLARADGKRLTVASAPRGGAHAAGLEATVRLPPCARPPGRLAVLLRASASGPGARVSVRAWVPRTGRWTALGARPLGTTDRRLRFAAPRAAAGGGAVRLRVVATGPAPFRARHDLLRVVVDS